MAYNVHLGLHPQPKRVLPAFLKKQTSMRVSQGPFQGMKLVEETFGSALLPKLVGTYELEIQKDLEEMLCRDYRCLIDIGAAEGYYAAGFATRLKGRGARILAYDISPESFGAVAQAAALNDVVGAIEMRGLCQHADFAAVESERCLVFCDIEGDAIQLLDPVSAPALNSCDIIVEVHDGSRASGIRDALTARFGGTHAIFRRTIRPRRHSELGRFRWMLTADLGQAAMHEGRTYGIEWLVMHAKRPAAK